jgi:hypothetical protein
MYRSRFGSIPDQDRINDGVALAAVKIIRNDVPLNFRGIAVIDCFWPVSAEEPQPLSDCFHAVCGPPHNGPQHTSNFQLLGDFKRIVDFNPKVPDSAFELRVAKQELDGPQVLRFPINQRRLGAPHGMGSIRSRIQPN